MRGLGYHVTFWQDLNVLVLGVFCAGAVVLLACTVVHDFLWRRKQRQRKARGEPAQTGERGTTGSLRRPASAVRPRAGGPERDADTSRAQRTGPRTRGMVR